MIKERAKLCSRCDRVLSRDKFALSNKTQDGRQRWCKECYQAYYQDRKGERAEPKWENPDQEKELLEALGPGSLLILSVFFRENEERISQALKRELTRRIREEPTQDSELLRALWSSASFVNRDMVPDLIKLRFIAEELLDRSGIDPLLVHINNQLYKLESYVDP